VLTDGEASDDGWHRVLADPTAFLSLGLCDERWLERAGPVLRDAAAVAPRAGSHLVHCDVRSDNICFRRGSALFVDWNFASVGNPQYDVACWLPSLAAEKGPRPEDVFGDCPAPLAAWVSGFFASRAGEPDFPHAPLVRQVQRRQLVTALPWAARVLGLPEP
jgi:Ser/Thr protein kinase RdoA (MazF antagonist)